MHEDSGIKKIAHCLLPGYRPPKVRFITLTFGGRYPGSNLFNIFDRDAILILAVDFS